MSDIDYQSEREHRTSKGRYVRTNGRSVPQQLSKIEQRQRSIRMIRESLNSSHLQRDPERIVVDPNTSYNMGISQNFPVHIPTFLQRNEGDLAIKVGILIFFLVLVPSYTSRAVFFAKVEKTSTSSHSSNT